MYASIISKEADANWLSHRVLRSETEAGLIDALIEKQFNHNSGIKNHKTSCWTGMNQREQMRTRYPEKR